MRNLARAFKNAARINANEKISEGKMQNASIFIPGNKEKLSINMSEVDFASYIMQVAIINVLFPQGIPITLINKLDEIGPLDKAMGV